MIDDGQKDIHGVDDILLAGWAAVVEYLEECVDAVTDEQAEQKDNYHTEFSQVFLRVICQVHILAWIMTE